LFKAVVILDPKTNVLVLLIVLAEPQAINENNPLLITFAEPPATTE